MEKESNEIPLKSRRLYIGNLDRAINEYGIIKLFKVFGSVSKLDFVTHKYGPLKGEPRGFCFLEYSNAQDAERALEVMNNKKVLGRALKVNFAQLTIESQYREYPKRDSCTRTDSSYLRKQRKMALASTSEKIFELESKLNQLKNTNSKESNTNFTEDRENKPTGQ